VANGCRGLLETVSTSIPLWVPLVVAILGLIGTAGGAIAGVVITQRRSDARDMTAWQRERDRERERWAREDAARTFELRREAYIEFYAAVSRQLGDFCLVYSKRRHPAAMAATVAVPSEEINADVHRAQQKLHLYGSSVVVVASGKIWKQVEETRGAFYMQGRSRDGATVEKFGAVISKNLEALEREEVELLRVIRVDLGIPAGEIEKTQG
jgi:hypothetical protein